MAFAMRSTSAETMESIPLPTAQPWRHALPLARDFPRAVFGPVLFFAFVRLDAILVSEVM
jgi:hypothetical protein